MGRENAGSQVYANPYTESPGAATHLDDHHGGESLASPHWPAHGGHHAAVAMSSQEMMMLSPHNPSGFDRLRALEALANSGHEEVGGDGEVGQSMAQQSTDAGIVGVGAECYADPPSTGEVGLVAPSHFSVSKHHQPQTDHHLHHGPTAQDVEMDFPAAAGHTMTQQQSAGAHTYGSGAGGDGLPPNYGWWGGRDACVWERGERAGRTFNWAGGPVHPLRASPQWAHNQGVPFDTPCGVPSEDDSWASNPPPEDRGLPMSQALLAQQHVHQGGGLKSSTTQRLYHLHHHRHGGNAGGVEADPAAARTAGSSTSGAGRQLVTSAEIRACLARADRLMK